MNIKLRSDILSKSLVLENLLSGILSVILNFPKEKSKSKSLGYTGNALSFKAKTDLLNDLQKLKPQEYNDLLMFMEIRNKLIHNLDIDTLKKAAECCDKINKILGNDNGLKKRYSSTIDLAAQEEILEIAFKQLYDRILKFSKEILETIIQESEDEEASRIESTQTEFLISIVGLIRNSFDIINKGLEDYSMEEGKEMKKTFLIFFYQQISQKYPNVYRNIETMNKLNRRKRS